MISRFSMPEVHDMMYTTLAPGPHLDTLNKSILDQILPSINNLTRTGSAQIKLWYWLRHHFSIASVNAIWGPQNPFQRYKDVEPAFWEFEANAMPLTMAPLPHVFARKGWKARKRVLDTFEEYVENGGYKDPETSQLIKNRAEILIGKYGLSKRMFAWGEASLLFGAILNTIPTAFWLISWIFADAQLCEAIRGEIEKCITTSNADSKKRTINATKLRTSCPLFTSAFRETLRLAGSININRHIAEDTTVTNSSTGESFLLKKDSIVQIASNVIHMRSLWGTDPGSFNAQRFMVSGERAKKEAEAGKLPDPAAPFRNVDGKLHSNSFRSFGSGNNICPGKSLYCHLKARSIANVVL